VLFLDERLNVLPACERVQVAACRYAMPAFANARQVGRVARNVQHLTPQLRIDTQEHLKSDREEQGLCAWVPLQPCMVEAFKSEECASFQRASVNWDLFSSV
jgi:hypothetical protein